MTEQHEGTTLKYEHPNLDDVQKLHIHVNVQDRVQIIAALRERLAQPEHHDPIGDAQDKLIAEQAAQPKMQPCAGRNCGSTNPNLHSAECFEDYEEATKMAQPDQWQGLTDEEVSKLIDNEIGFNSCWGPEEQFARAVEAKLKEKNT